MIHLSHTSHGFQLTILGRRIHHGLLGALLMLHDRRDWLRWLTDLRRARP